VDSFPRTAAVTIAEIVTGEPGGLHKEVASPYVCGCPNGGSLASANMHGVEVAGPITLKYAVVQARDGANTRLNPGHRMGCTSVGMTSPRKPTSSKAVRWTSPCDEPPCCHCLSSFPTKLSP
jgi:hypothetical protein